MPLRGRALVLRTEPQRSRVSALAGFDPYRGRLAGLTLLSQPLRCAVAARAARVGCPRPACRAGPPGRGRSPVLNDVRAGRRDTGSGGASRPVVPGSRGLVEPRYARGARAAVTVPGVLAASGATQVLERRVARRLERDLRIPADIHAQAPALARQRLLPVLGAGALEEARSGCATACSRRTERPRRFDTSREPRGRAYLGGVSGEIRHEAAGGQRVRPGFISEQAGEPGRRALGPRQFPRRRE